MPFVLKQGLTSVILLVLVIPVVAQEHVRRLISAPINEKQLVTIHGTVHPLAQPRYDAGSLPDSFPINRMLLLLNRPGEREADL